MNGTLIVQILNQETGEPEKEIRVRREMPAQVGPPWLENQVQLLWEHDVVMLPNDPKLSHADRRMAPLAQ